MSFQNLLKILKMCDCRQFLSPVSIASVCRHQQLKYCSKVNSECLPSENFGERLDHLGEKCIEEDVKPEEDFSTVKITVVVPKEKIETQINARLGMTIMDAVLKHDSQLMPNACDGQLCCKTCHCLVEEKDMYYFTQPGDSEEDMLDAFANAKTNSRLACQMKIIEKFEHVRIEIVPEVKEDEKEKECS